MAHLDPESGLMVDDEEGAAGDNGGSVGEQAGAPSFAPPPIPASNPLAQPLPETPDPASFVAQPSGGGVVTRRPVLSPADTANLAAMADNGAALDANAAATRDTAEQAGDAKVSRAVDEAANAQFIADEKDKQAAAAEQERQRHEARIAKLQAEHEALYEKHKAMGLKDPDANSSFGHKLAAALAIGLGQYSAAINHTSNAAAKIFEDARQENFAMQRENIAKAKDDAIAAGVNVKEALADEARSLAALHVKQIAQIDAFRSKFAAESARLGIPEARIAATQTMQALDKAALQERDKHLDMNERHLESTRIYERGLTPKEAGRGKGGGGGGGAISELVKMKEAGATDGDIAVRAEALHLKPKDYLPSIANVDKTIGMRGKTKDEIDPRAVMIGGKPIGLAPTARQVDSFEKRFVQYDDAIDSVKALMENLKAHPTMGKIPMGSDYDRAVLAVAATTQANASDTTTAHEAGTIKNYKLVDMKGLEDTLHHLEKRKTAFAGNLRPMPGGGEAAASEKPAANAAPAPEAKPAQKSDKERAQALIDSPAYAGFSADKKAYLLRLARGK